MTREEAIEWLKAEKNARMCFSNLRLCEAIDMAIEALSTQQKWIDEELQNYLIENADLVTCKDCRHAYYADNRVPHEKTWVCERFMNEEITSNDFCSWAERRDINP